MYFKTADKTLYKRLETLVPQIQQILCSRFVSFLTMDVSTLNNNWTHTDKILNEEHIEAMAYLQCNFKNHIINKRGCRKMERIINFLDQSGNHQLQDHLWGSDEKVPVAYKKNFYIFDPSFKLDELEKLKLIKNKCYAKIICFPKAQPIQLNSELQKFCRYYNIKALGLTDYTLQSLMGQIERATNQPTLIHQLVQENPQLYKDPSGKRVPTELIIFMNKVQINIGKIHNFPTLKQLVKFYMHRRSFSTESRTKFPNFKISRFQHLSEVQKYSQAVLMHEDILESEEF